MKEERYFIVFFKGLRNSETVETITTTGNITITKKDGKYVNNKWFQKYINTRVDNKFSWVIVTNIIELDQSDFIEWDK